MYSIKNNQGSSTILTIFANIVITIVIVVIAILTAPYWLTPVTHYVELPNKEKIGDTFPHTKVKVMQEDSAVIDVVEKVDPSVVSIIVTKDLVVLERGNDPFDGFFDDPFFEDFRSRFIMPENVEPPEDKKITKEIGGGSGFFISEDGLIVTNKHVVSDEQADYTVLINDGEKYNAKVLARDPLNDIAILQIEIPEGEDIKFIPMEIGDSDKLKVGQSVIAIGNALGEYRNTVSKGVVSGLARDITAGSAFYGGSEFLEGVIQTDAAINQGNSGGPLLNLEGQVIGVNVAMARGAQSIGFSIPINSVKNTIQTVKENGRIVRPIIGVRYIPVTESLKKKNNLSVDYGALVIRGPEMDDLAVLPGSPADIAGIVEYDIILEINGNKIDLKNTLAKEIMKYKVGDEITLKIMHKGEEKEAKLTLIESPEDI